ncbi:MAG: hypothetical protein ABJN40_05940 [Sneathiella sp.]
MENEATTTQMNLDEALTIIDGELHDSAVFWGSDNTQEELESVVDAFNLVRTLAQDSQRSSAPPFRLSVPAEDASKIIAEMTDRNAHTEALLYLGKIASVGDFLMNILHDVETDQEIHNELTQLASNVRELVRGEIWEHLKTRITVNDYQILWDSF